MAPRDYGRLCAEFYDLTKPVGGEYADVPYYGGRLTCVNGRVLEAGVGTGRLIVPLLHAGIDVHGIDRSEEMLARCRENCADRGLEPTLHSGDISTMRLPHRYAAIVIAYGSFQLLSESGEASAALERLRAHLIPGGWLFADVETLDSSAGPAVGSKTRRETAARDGSTIVLVDTLVEDGRAGGPDAIERHVLTYEKWRKGRLVDREVQDFHLRRFGREELTTLLSQAGFADIEVCGDHDEAVAAEEAVDWICFSARRPS